ncbi:hypothetical protein GCM10027054_30950 [Isoptericola nanjingensis]
MAREHVPLGSEQTTYARGRRHGRRKPRSYVEGVSAMGRGRQKAKQTKVARELKYYSPETNYHALEQELKGSEGGRTDVATEDRFSDDDEYDNRYNSWGDER